MVIDRRHVPKSAYTGKYIHFKTFSGRIESFFQCRMHISTPYYTSIGDLCSNIQSGIQLIVGQLRGVTKCTNQEVQQSYKMHGMDPILVLRKCGCRIHTYTCGGSKCFDNQKRFTLTLKRLQQEQQERAINNGQTDILQSGRLQPTERSLTTRRLQ